MSSVAILEEIEQSIIQARNRQLRLQFLLDNVDIIDSQANFDCKVPACRESVESHKLNRVLMGNSCVETPAARKKSISARPAPFSRNSDPEVGNITHSINTTVNIDSLVHTPAPSSNPVTKAIVDKIIHKYGSMEEYHRIKKFSKPPLSQRAINKAEEELKECTFQPNTGNKRKDKDKPPVVSKTPLVLPAGADSFISRQEKAREIKCVQNQPKPGSGLVYKGIVTKPVPFSFSSKNEFVPQIRE